MPSLSEIQRELTHLRAKVLVGQQTMLADWQPILADSEYAKDAANLAAYITFRREDLRSLQEGLSELGLSSLGRCEGHVSATLDAVALALNALNGERPPDAALPMAGRANRRGENCHAGGVHS